MKASVVVIGWLALAVPTVILGGIVYAMVAIEPTAATWCAASGALAAFALLLIHLRWACEIMVKSTREVLARRAKQPKVGG